MRKNIKVGDIVSWKRKGHTEQGEVVRVYRSTAGGLYPDTFCRIQLSMTNKCYPIQRRYVSITEKNLNILKRANWYMYFYDLYRSWYS